MGGVVSWIQSLFWKQEMDLTLVGLQNSGKTTLVNIMSGGEYQQDQIPTVGFNMSKITRGNVTIKLWDIGGQPRFRSMWARYCRGVSAILFVLDGADEDKFETATKELHDLINKPPLAGIPLLVVGNKNDIHDLKEEEIAEIMKLHEIKDREVACYSISAKNGVNIDRTLEW
eukprot:CAMPEP_0201551808 /NCGR_PEP_ID=MMETSP0173_2-20130828/10339_1 /ASSEMBLY_ACC=CAM_ASM_000268 /TAXON_ID=218659 /ORGANISM="Vexillifera sp., Strain DIVA3 564/2" /LENGTH=171 /DNA_ID=CAMNT_0047962145 /DNA_START=57 /DNA_END=569 /DNA_ORIENTATION=+